MPLVTQATIEVMRVIASEPRLRLIELIGLGHDHPDELARKMQTSRQAVDKHLELILDLGFIERDAIYPRDGRPKIVYRLTPTAVELIGEIGKLVETFRLRLEEQLRTNQEELDSDLADGKIDQEVHARRMKDLRARFSLVSSGHAPVPRKPKPPRR